MRTSLSLLAGLAVSALLTVPPAAAQTGTVILPDVYILEAFVNRSVSIQLSVQNPPPGANLLGWAVTSGQLPPGLSLNPATGLISGTPSTAGIVTFTVRATYQTSTGQPLQYSRTYGFNVDYELVFLTPSPLPPATAQTPFERQILASMPVSSWSYESNLPAGVRILAQPESNQMTISGAFPALDSPTTYTVRVTIFGGRYIAQEKTQTYQIRVYPVPSLSPAEPVARLGQPYSSRITPSGGVAPFVFSLVGGSLPPGLSLDRQTGTISGVPTSVGEFAFTILAVDANQAPARLAMSIRVLAAFQILTESLPEGRVGQPYEARLETEGGTSPVTFSLASGQIPPGLSLSSEGVLRGTPTAAGTFLFEVSATDSSQPAQRALRSFRLQILLPPLPELTLTQLGDTVAPASQPSFGLQLSAPFPVELTGSVTLAFTPDQGLPADPAVRFANGSTSLSFTIPAGQTQAVPAAGSLFAFQAGTTAGTITLTVVLRSGSETLSPNPALVKTVRVPASGPQIVRVAVARTASGFELQVTGFASTRQVTGATFRFTPAPGAVLATTELSVPVASAFETWFASEPSRSYGGQFLLTVSFSVSGSVNHIASVQVTLTNSAGSGSGSASF